MIGDGASNCPDSCGVATAVAGGGGTAPSCIRQPMEQSLAGLV